MASCNCNCWSPSASFFYQLFSKCALLPYVDFLFTPRYIAQGSQHSFSRCCTTYAGLPIIILESSLRARTFGMTIILGNRLPNRMLTSYALISSTQEKCSNISGERNITSESIWHLEEHLSCKRVFFFCSVKVLF